MSDDDINLPPLPRVQVPLIEADVSLLDIRVLARWCERIATDHARAAVLADRASRASSPQGDAHPGYAGVTVWVGDTKYTAVVTETVLGAARCDVLLECFKKARHAVRAAQSAAATVPKTEFSNLLAKAQQHPSYWEERIALARDAAREEATRSSEALLRQALEALGRAHQTAMEQTLKARVPECAEFAGIAQDLDFVVATIDAAMERESSGE